MKIRYWGRPDSAQQGLEDRLVPLQISGQTSSGVLCSSMEPIYAKTQGSAGKRVAESNKDDQSF